MLSGQRTRDSAAREARGHPDGGKRVESKRIASRLLEVSRNPNDSEGLDERAILDSNQWPLLRRQPDRLSTIVRTRPIIHNYREWGRVPRISLQAGALPRIHARQDRPEANELPQ
jgi:hypothetical protein